MEERECGYMTRIRYLHIHTHTHIPRRCVVTFTRSGSKETLSCALSFDSSEALPLLLSRGVTARPEERFGDTSEASGKCLNFAKEKKVGSVRVCGGMTSSCAWRSRASVCAYINMST